MTAKYYDDATGMIRAIATGYRQMLGKAWTAHDMAFHPVERTKHLAAMNLWNEVVRQLELTADERDEFAKTIAAFVDLDGGKLDGGSNGFLS